MIKPKLILDLDGVLITTATWKADEIDSDGYSKFNTTCVSNLNRLLKTKKFDIVLSSTRRTVKSLDDFNEIFMFRQINSPITEFLPNYKNCRNRKEEIECYIQEVDIKDFLIIDDDKSLNDANQFIKDRLIQTELLKGFNTDKLKEAINVISNCFSE
ncbi:HAD domain-containing protein [Aureibacter tunicatorum]|uniref:Uncharacterized protein n=1 Tax=Aureibacter tunicatorum TaxID=866807 RepID=A0AAE4BS45_9BACT|nr:HAD domain-containing protein [Aureibacter tunicatorum]MDR6238495.1 hypothetical protein [Aureibacter tunicatorum]BDD05572.1 hypothetical protein AUTU_30550 [Aureibacter tunicatorum]